MAESKTLARPYAEAAFALAKAGNALAQWSKMLRVMTEVATDERVVAVATDPGVSQQQLTGLLLNVCGDVLDHNAKNLIRLLVENARLASLPEILEQFEQLQAEAEGIVGPVALKEGDITRRIRQFHQAGEVQSRGPAADDDDFHGCQPRSISSIVGPNRPVYIARA